MRCVVGDARCAPLRLCDTKACCARRLRTERVSESPMTDEPAAIVPEARPRLPHGVRLVESQAHCGWVLLAPERVFKADTIAVEIIKRCTGEATLADIVDDLAGTYAAPRDR